MRVHPSFRRTTSLFLAAAFLFSACGRFGDRAPDELGGSIVAGLSEIGALDPAHATSASAFTLLRTACDGLIGLDRRTGAPRAALADSWTLEPGNRKLTLQLRQGAQFQDGTPVDQGSVREALSRVARPSTASPWAGLVSRIDGFKEVQGGEATHLSGVQSVGESGIAITLSEPFADFATVLAHPALIPVSLESLGRVPVEDELPVCSGPYRIEHGEGSDLRLGKISGGRNDGFLNRGAGSAELIIVRSYDSSEDAYQAYKGGQVDVAQVPDSRVGEASQAPGYHSEPTPQVTFLGFDPANAQTSDVRLRQAISLALNRLVIIDAAFGDQRRPAAGWLPATPPEGSSCTGFIRRVADPGRAQQLLASTGIDRANFKLSLYYDGRATGRLVVEALELQLEQVLGIAVESIEPEGQDLATHFLTKPAGPSMWLMTSTVDLPLPDAFLGNLFRTGSASNVLGFSDPQFDRRIDEARGASTQADITREYSQAESQLCEAMPAVPLWTGVSRWMFSPERVEVEGGAFLDLLGTPLLRHARAQED